MNTATAPGFGIVLRQQLRLLWLSRRPQMLAALMIGALLMIRAVAWWANTQHDMNIEILFTQVTGLVIMIGAAWGIIVWRDDPPKHRRYHWSLPVDVTHHDLARVLAGALWLLVALTAYYVTGSLLALADGHAAQVRSEAGFTVLLYTLAPLLAYMLLSGLGVVSNRPFEWVLGLFLGMQAAVALMVILGRDNLLTRIIDVVFGGSRGLGVALSGATPLGGWLQAVLLWLVIATALVTLAAVGRRGRA